MISVIITTYQREPYFVDRAINSVLCQTYKDIEIIVVDDSPADYSLRKDVERIVLERDKSNSVSIRYIAHDRNKGACAARNTGMQNAKGEYVAYLDDDDEWLPEKLDKQIKVFNEEDVALVYCGRICKNDVSGVSTIEKTGYYKGYVFEKLLYINFVGSTSFPLIKTSCLRNVGGFDVEMQSAQDVDVWLRIAQKYQIGYVSEPLVIYHMHGGEQITSNPQKKIMGLEQLNKKYQAYLDKDPDLWHRRNIFITPYYAMAGNKRKALSIWLACVYKCPGKMKDNIKYLRLIMKGKKKNKNGR